MGAWLTYGLGSESRDLPAFVVFSSGAKGPSGGNSCWGSGFLPTVYQGVQFRSSGDPVLYLSNPPGVDKELERDSLDSIRRLNQMRLGVTGDPEIATRISSFEMAFRMQSSAPELMDVSREPKQVLEMYGAEPGKPSFANNCLLARRLVERGVRFVQLYHEAWDQHGNLVKDIKKNCQDTDQACAALVQDLKQRGMLDSTLVVWGGEFGRTPMSQGGNDGRDHHPNAFTMWLAGGGIKSGITLGESDELGFNVVKDKVHVHDLQATILHLLGFDHTKLTYRFQGRDFRLTDVHGQLVKQILEWHCIGRRAYYRLGAAPIVCRTRVAHDSLLAQRFKHNVAVVQQMAKYPVQAVATKRQLKQAVGVGEPFGLSLEYAQVPTKRLG